MYDPFYLFHLSDCYFTLYSRIFQFNDGGRNYIESTINMLYP